MDSKGADLVRAVSAALGDDSRFSFGDLLDRPNVQEVGPGVPRAVIFAHLTPLTRPQLAQDTAGKTWLNALNLFAYGTYEDYVKNKSTYPELNAEQLGKLRVLTVVSMASNAKSIRYSDMMRATGVKTVEDAEDLATESIRQGLVRGKHNPREGVFVVDFTEGRDISQEDLVAMEAKMGAWIAASERALQMIKKNAAQARGAYDQELKDASDVKEAKKKIAAKLSQTKTGGLAGFALPQEARSRHTSKPSKSRGAK